MVAVEELTTVWRLRCKDGVFCYTHHGGALSVRYIHHGDAQYGYCEPRFNTNHMKINKMPTQRIIPGEVVVHIKLSHVVVPSCLG